jgi:hypothetical protein
VYFLYNNYINTKVFNMLYKISIIIVQKLYNYKKLLYSDQKKKNNDHPPPLELPPSLLLGELTNCTL